MAVTEAVERDAGAKRGVRPLFPDQYASTSGLIGSLPFPPPEDGIEWLIESIYRVLERATRRALVSEVMKHRRRLVIDAHSPGGGGGFRLPDVETVSVSVKATANRHREHLGLQAEIRPGQSTHLGSSGAGAHRDSCTM